MPAISRAALLLPSGRDIRIGSAVDGLTVSGLARAVGSLLAHRNLNQSQAMLQLGNWRAAEGNPATPSLSAFRVLHQVGPFAKYCRVAFWYSRSEEKPTGGEEVEIEWKDGAGTTFATMAWGEDVLAPTPSSSVRTIDSGSVRTQGALVAQEGYAEAPLDADGSDPDPRLVDVSAYRGQTIGLFFTLNRHRVYSVHVSDVAVEVA